MACRDEGLKHADRYIDAMNVVAFYGCFDRQGEKIIQEIIHRLVGGMRELESYSTVFGFNHIVWDAIVYGSGAAEEYVGYDWKDGFVGYMKHIGETRLDDVLRNASNDMRV